ncbi:MAG: AAA family ATPase [Marmoricola sp.]|nr:AAA family ATPase [Marmoricola sp.]
MLVGRDVELAHLEGLLEQARHGSAASIVVRGEPGIGKTALLDQLVAGSPGVKVLRTAGVESEAPMAFAALHRLLRPLTRLREELPAPQTHALQVAFGESEGPSVEPFLVAIATLSMLTLAAEESPVVCVVEDAHWLDPATADALLFTARRLGADRILMVFSVRDGVSPSFHAEGVPELTLGGLEPAAAAALLDRRSSGARDAAVTERLLAEAAGNPLALLELPAALTDDQLSGEARLPDQLPLSSRVEQVFLDRSAGLSSQVQALLLIAAADDTGRIEVLRQAGSHLGLDDEAVDGALEGALESGLLVEDSKSVSVRHPLVRSAIYQAATADRRRKTHRALAQALTGLGEPEREAWHRAAAAAGPDPEAAHALAGVGARAEHRGGAGAAMRAFERAAALSVGSRRAELTLAAARTAWASGHLSAARELLADARALATGPVLVHDVARLQGHVEVNIGSAVEAHRIFVDAAHAVHEFDPARALETAVAAALLQAYAADSGARLLERDVLTEPAPSDSLRTRCLRPTLRAMTLASEGDWGDAVTSLDTALSAGVDVEDVGVLANLGNAALQLGDDVAQQRFYNLAMSRARDLGSVTGVVYTLQRLCFGHLLAGDLNAIRASAQEAIALSASIGQSGLSAAPRAWLAFLAAVQDDDEYETTLRNAEDTAARFPLGILADPVHDVTRWAKSARASGSGDTFAALSHLGRLRLPVLRRMAAVDLVDAAVRAGEPETVAALLKELGVFAAGTRRPWALAAVAFGHAMTTEDATKTEEAFEQAITQHATAGRPLEEARIRLSYGEWLRRAQRRVDSRGHLRHALETFTDARAEIYARRAAEELRASGETARKRDVSTLVDLTPMERKVAQLVATGLSNKDVAAQIWVSPRTVAFHLRNVFAKAGVTSRAQLVQLDLT